MFGVFERLLCRDIVLHAIEMRNMQPVSPWCVWPHAVHSALHAARAAPHAVRAEPHPIPLPAAQRELEQMAAAGGNQGANAPTPLIGAIQSAIHEQQVRTIFLRGNRRGNCMNL